jgi:hypothetical protein
MWFRRRRRDDEARQRDAVDARIIRARLESIIDRQDSVYERLEKKLGLDQLPNTRNGDS